MKKQMQMFVTLFTLVLAGSAWGGGQGQALQEVLAASGHWDDVPVIVKFTDQLDIEALRKQTGRTLKERYPDPKERKVHRKALKRAMMVDGLRKKAAASLALVRTFLQARGEHRKLTSLWSSNAVAAHVPAYLLDDLAALPGVERVVLDATIQGPGTGSAPSAPSNWNLDAIGAPTLWQLGHTGLGVVVATLDTGVDASHPDLGPRWRGGANSWLDPYAQHTTPADLNGHGTRVLGLIVGGDAGGYQIGLAPDAQWIAAKIFDDANEATLSGIHLAYQWLLDPDGDAATDDAPDLVNNSWDLAGTVDQCNQEYSQDILLLREAGIAVVFAGGNYGPSPNTSVSPSNDPATLSVGAVDSNFIVDSQSSRGAGACDGGIYPNLVAPGSGVLTTDLMPTFYNVVSGTSFAVAHLTGGMALLQSAFPTATLSQLETSVIESTMDLGAPGADDDYGHGLLDLVAAHDWLAAAVGGGGGTPGSIQLGASTYSADETAANLMVTIARSGGSSGQISVDYATSDASATAGLDYQATSGTLTFLDGEVSRALTVAILDDSLYEGDEEFTLALGNPQGGATLGAQQNATLTILDDDPLPGPADNDGDGFTADIDCNDADTSVYPGAAEVKHDGIDQDCNGYDLTIDVTRTRYLGAKDKLIVWATSALGNQAALQVTIEQADGGSLTKTLTWKAAKGRWQKTLRTFVARFGALPVAVSVFGVEGAESAPVEQR